MPSLERRHKHFVTDTSESADGQFRVDVILLWAVIEVIPALGTYLGHRGGTPASPRHAKLWHCAHPTSGCVPLPGARPSQDRPLSVAELPGAQGVRVIRHRRSSTRRWSAALPPAQQTVRVLV